MRKPSTVFFMSQLAIQMSYMASVLIENDCIVSSRLTFISATILSGLFLPILWVEANSLYRDIRAHGQSYISFPKVH